MNLQYGLKLLTADGYSRSVYYPIGEWVRPTMKRNRPLGEPVGSTPQETMYDASSPSSSEIMSIAAVFEYHPEDCSELNLVLKLRRMADGTEHLSPGLRDLYDAYMVPGAAVRLAAESTDGNYIHEYS
jgi:hypothetical protein